MNRLRGVDATLYIRFLRGCRKCSLNFALCWRINMLPQVYFTVLHMLSTFLVLFPIHVELSRSDVPSKSMTRASITSLVLSEEGESLLWVHIILLFWVTLTWVGTLVWVCNGAFSLRAAQIRYRAEYLASERSSGHTYNPHPHLQFGFTETPDRASYQSQPGLPLRTVMVSNVPPTLRSDAALKEYFEFYMTRDLDKPAIGIGATTQPGFFNKSFAFVFNRAKRLPMQMEALQDQMRDGGSPRVPEASVTINTDNKPVIERVVIARKMTELADLLERREDILRQLETAHLKLAQRTVLAVKVAIVRRDCNKNSNRVNSKAATARAKSKKASDVQRDHAPANEDDDGCDMTEEERMDQLIEEVGPFVDEFELRFPKESKLKKPRLPESKRQFRKLRTEGSVDEGQLDAAPPGSPDADRHNKTIWEALLAVPRSSLDPYQPLISLSTLFRGKTVPTIDYLTRKLAVLNDNITENRSRAVASYSPVSTAFVSFSSVEDARKACRYLAVHPDNPLACMVSMAPQYSDLDWIRVMKTSYNTEVRSDYILGVHFLML